MAYYANNPHCGSFPRDNKETDSMSRNFNQLIKTKWAEKKFLCIGLDSDRNRLPSYVQGMASPASRIVIFNRAIVRATKDLVCAYKPNIAFYSWGLDGLKALEETIAMIHAEAPDVPVILDAKRGDIDSTNNAYADEVFEWFKADATTISPYLGMAANEPFLRFPNKGIFVLCRTSNASAPEFQGSPEQEMQAPLFLTVADRVSRFWNTACNCGLVVGATYPEELRRVRQAAPCLPLLIPGVGTQGGDLEKTVVAARDCLGGGMIINASRSVIFASPNEDFTDAARAAAMQQHQQIRACL